MIKEYCLSPPFNPVKMSPSYPQRRGPTPRHHTRPQKSDPSGFQYQFSLLTVENLVSLVQICPFSQKGWVKVSTISRFHCCLIVFVRLTWNFSMCTKSYRLILEYCTLSLLGYLWRGIILLYVNIRVPLNWYHIIIRVPLKRHYTIIGVPLKGYYITTH